MKARSLPKKRGASGGLKTKEARRHGRMETRKLKIQGFSLEEEGCLSIPNFTARVHRPYRVVVSGKDIHGKETIVEGEGLLSRILAHEIDHLNGVLFIDHLSSIKRDIIKRKIRKKVRAP